MKLSQLEGSYQEVRQALDIKPNQIIVFRHEQGKKVSGKIFDRKTGQLLSTINKSGHVKRSN